jgi:hypothetical protein
VNKRHGDETSNSGREGRRQFVWSVWVGGLETRVGGMKNKRKGSIFVQKKYKNKKHAANGEKELNNNRHGKDA